MSRISNAHTVSIGSLYPLPSAGNIQAIGPATGASTIIPSGMSELGWHRAIFNTYGAGAFVEGYSALGAYALTGGGHQAPRCIGAAIFDFTTATWVRADPQGGTYSDSDYSLAETNGEAGGCEINGSGGVPSPGHPWTSMVALPASGSLPKGGFVYVTRTGVTMESSGTYYCHVMNLATGVWSKLTTSIPTYYGSDCTAVVDSNLNRIWFLVNGQHGHDSHQYLDLTSMTWGATATYSYPPVGLERGAALMYGTYLLRQGRRAWVNTWYLYDPALPAAGWVTLNMTGTLPSDERNCFAYYPPNGKFYSITELGGATLTRVTPPATNPKTNQWVVDSVTLNSALPARTSLGGRQIHYRGLVYVPSIQRLAWFPGGPEYVYLIHPGA